MTKKLEDILNLPNVKEAFKEVDAKEKVKSDKDKVNGKSKNLDPETHKKVFFRLHQGYFTNSTTALGGG